MMRRSASKRQRVFANSLFDRVVYYFRVKKLMERKLENRLAKLQGNLEHGEFLLQLLTENVDQAKKNLQASFDLNAKKLEQYAQMKRVLIEAALSEISADMFRTESLLTAIDVVSETQQISDRPVSVVDVSVDDVPLFASARELSLVEALAGKDAEISGLKAEIARLTLLAKDHLSSPNASDAAILKAARDVFHGFTGRLSRVEFFTKLHARGYQAADVEKLMLKATDENGDVWINRLLDFSFFVSKSFRYAVKFGTTADGINQ